MSSTVISRCSTVESGACPSPWNGWRRNPSAMGASGAIHRAICAGHVMRAGELASRNAPSVGFRSTIVLCRVPGLAMMPACRAAQPRLRPAWHDGPVRRVQHRRWHGHLLPVAPPPGRGVQEVPGPNRQGRARRPRGAPGLRQPRHPQDPGHPGLASPPLRFRMHFTPTGSSWIHQVERWFGYLTDLDVGFELDHVAVDAIRGLIRGFVMIYTR